MMGEYRDGKWVPTFGDDQFGVCDSPAMRAENAARTEEFIEKMTDHIRALEAELAKAKNTNDELRHRLADERNALQRISDADEMLVELLSTGHTISTLIEMVYEQIKDDQRFELDAKHGEPLDAARAAEDQADE